MQLGQAVGIIMGANIGTCVTAMISSVWATKNAKRAVTILARTVLAWKKNIPMNNATLKFIEFLRK